jgi:hypothetical protein
MASQTVIDLISNCGGILLFLWISHKSLIVYLP